MFHKHLIKWFGSLILLAAFTGQIAAAAKNTTNAPVQNASSSETIPQDIVLVIDTSSAMAYETRSGGNDFRYDPDHSGEVSENPQVCNQSSSNPCQPMQGVKSAALDFLDTLDFAYDRVGIVALTGQETDGSAKRHPVVVLGLSTSKTDVENAINSLNVFQPHECDPVLDEQAGLDSYDPDNDPTTDDDPGVCLRIVNDAFASLICQSMEVEFNSGFYNYAPCPSSNIGGALRLASETLSGPDPRLDSNWATIVLSTGPATSTDTPENYPATLYTDGVPAAYSFGYCPANEYYPSATTDINDNGVYDYRFCTDGNPDPSTRHHFSDTMWFTKKQVVFNQNDTKTVTYPPAQEISIYDPDDYARDWADRLADLRSGGGVSLYTIGIGAEVQSTARTVAGQPALAETLLQYIAEEAGSWGVDHGFYSYAPHAGNLSSIFQAITDDLNDPGGFIPFTYTPTFTATPVTSTLTPTSTSTNTPTTTRTKTPTTTATEPTSTPTNTSTATVLNATLLSQPVNDGWILESSETSNNGGTMNSTATTMRLGDNASDKQYRGILSFDLSAIPDNAVITSAVLKFKYASKTGTLPFGTHGNLFVDVRNGSFRNNPMLQLNDFAAPSSKDKILVYTQTMTNNWFTRSFNTADLTYLDDTDIVQFRLRFSKDDNNDMGADFLNIYSGDAGAANRPQLLIQYYVVVPTNTPTNTSTINPNFTSTNTKTNTPTITRTPFNPD
jgi:hypothetical protein